MDPSLNGLWGYDGVTGIKKQWGKRNESNLGIRKKGKGKSKRNQSVRSVQNNFLERAGLKHPAPMIK
jgi:hypothetical protein